MDICSSMSPNMDVDDKTKQLLRSSSMVDLQNQWEKIVGNRQACRKIITTSSHFITTTINFPILPSQLLLLCWSGVVSSSCLARVHLQHVKSSGCDPTSWRIQTASRRWGWRPAVELEGIYKEDTVCQYGQIDAKGRGSRQRALVRSASDRENHDAHVRGDNGGLDYNRGNVRRDNADVLRAIREVSRFLVYYSGG